ncbi:hypothetical protein P168DRAFT_315774 [Aspergillus campestris IBT 28561]|uniref:Uncharacterized protein n=1 Tax=Aspergillus campestris (strain IBT 28561) TaxID=1392248 RepID=A0A2I1DBK0_ASPC2|nr:uncharacterized protein P168DRAFT_315774 [Aspergillus campestris IBT 28561]PKY07262.1 hypothetical protein P168DRAFT_315774 [Aspergillus campestris IBT 28561]
MRPSLSFVFGSQKPTFAGVLNNMSPTYDTINSPILPSSPLISRQKIAPQLEADVRYACSLLVYRIEQGVPAPGAHRISTTSEAAVRSAEVRAAQIESKYLTPSVGPEVAKRATKFDSGVGLTQQPSMQTMRNLHSSHSDRRSDTGSIFSRNRCATPGSNTTSAWDTDPSSGRASLKSPRKQSRQPKRPGDYMRSMNGAPATGVPQTHVDMETLTFLMGPEPDGFQPPPAAGPDDSPENFEVFLNADATFATGDVPSFCSPQPGLLHPAAPSFGLPNGDASTPPRIPAPMRDGPSSSRPSIGLAEETDDEAADWHERPEPAVIIDSSGFMHIMTAEEEEERHQTLQQAVLARMNTAPADSSPQHPQEPAPAQLQQNHSEPEPQHRPRPSTTPSRPSAPPQLSSRPATTRSRQPTSGSTRNKLSMLTKRKSALRSPGSSHPDLPEGPPLQRQGRPPSMFQRLAGWFGKRRGGTGVGAAVS